MNRIIKSMVLIVCLSVTLIANALCVQTNNKIGLTGLDNTNGQLYAGVAESSNQCGCQEFRFKENATDLDAALSLLIAAKLSDKLIRVDISDPNDCNSAIRVYLQ